MEKILIFGASGLLGSSMSAAYSKDYRVFGTYVTTKPAIKDAYLLDATQKEKVSELIRKVAPDVVIDAHGLTGLDYCEENKDKAWKVNVEGAQSISEAANEIGCKMIYISTDNVFDGSKSQPYTEEDNPNPINYYGVTKFAAECAIRKLGSDYIIARTAVLFGFGHRKLPSFTNSVIEQLSTKQKMYVASDQYVSPTYTDNVVEMVRELHEKNTHGIFHTAGKEIVSRFEFAGKIADVFGLDKDLLVPATSAELNFKTKRALMLGLNVSKVENEIQVKPMGLNDALMSFKRKIGK